jgi:hypothetical protein
LTMLFRACSISVFISEYKFALISIFYYRLPIFGLVNGGV